jgi:betaine-aldehyde dehydrogenase
VSVEVQNLVDGKRVATADGRTSELIDPTTGTAYGTAALSGTADVSAATAAAARAFETWRWTTPSERQLAMLRIADAIEARSAELVAAESRNTGKPLALTASEEVPPMVDQIRFFAGAARVLEGRSAGEYLAGHTSFVRREPVGVCAQVTPWNYPMMMAVWKFAPALAAGNTVVLKPSDTTPVTTALLAEIAAEFLPPGVFNVVCGDRDTGALLVDDEVPAMVSITGSVRAGMAVAEAASRRVKRVHLELGGKAPVVVFDDADIAAAAEAIALAGYFNGGQDCTAATRVLAGPRVHRDLLDALTEQARQTRTGMPDDEDVLYGPLNNAGQLARVGGFVDRLPVAPGRARPATSTSRPWSAGWCRATRSSPTRSSGRSSRSSSSLTRPRRCAGPTPAATASRPVSGPATTAGRCGWPGRWTSAACGSTPTSRSSPRCRTAASAPPATARTCRCTASRTTPASST